MFAGQFIISIGGKKVDKEIIDFLREYKPLGIILFKENIPESYDELREFIYELKGKAGYELTICIDQEGGRVKRIDTPFELPAARELGEAFERGLINEQDIFELGEKLGAFLARHGIDVNFSPVLDLYCHNHSVIGDRAFSSDPEVVAKIGIALSKGMMSTGVIPVGKHFPGHGLVKEDSHIELPISEADNEEVGKHIRTFRQVSHAIRGIMTAHIVVKSIDSKLPCTLSPNCIKMLKEFFPGCVISDDLTMGALKEFGEIHEVALMAISAGCDVILICKKDINFLAKTFEKFFELTKKEKIENLKREKLLENAKRIAYLKFRRKFA